MTTATDTATKTAYGLTYAERIERENTIITVKGAWRKESVLAFLMDEDRILWKDNRACLFSIPGVLCARFQDVYERWAFVNGLNFGLKK
jgi:hypothetical protein